MMIESRLRRERIMVMSELIPGIWFNTPPILPSMEERTERWFEKSWRVAYAWERVSSIILWLESIRPRSARSASVWEDLKSLRSALDIPVRRRCTAGWFERDNYNAANMNREENPLDLFAHRSKQVGPLDRLVDIILV